MFHSLPLCCFSLVHNNCCSSFPCSVCCLLFVLNKITFFSLEHVLSVNSISSTLPPHCRTSLRSTSFPKADPDPKALPAHFSSSPAPHNPSAVFSVPLAVMDVSVCGIRQGMAASSWGPHRNQGNTERWKTHHRQQRHRSQPKARERFPLPLVQTRHQVTVSHRDRDQRHTSRRGRTGTG